MAILEYVLYGGPLCYFIFHIFVFMFVCVSRVWRTLYIDWYSNSRSDLISRGQKQISIFDQLYSGEISN